MATFDLEEQEQISELKLFWQQNGKFILTAIASVLVALAAWQGWNWHTATRANEANAIFGQLADAANAKDAEKFKALANQINSVAPGSVQAALGSMMMAKFALEAKDAATAKQFLQTATQARDAGLRDIATLRLAALLIDENKTDEAIKLVSVEPSPGFAVRFIDAKGDALAAAGKSAEARAAWQDALVKIDALQKGETGAEKTHAALRDMIVAKLDTVGQSQ